MLEPLLIDIRRFSNDPQADELAAAVLVTRALNDSLDPAELKARVHRLVADCSEPERPWLYLAGLGFGGDSASYGSVDNSRLDWLLDQRRGIPISLGVLLIHVARGVGLTAAGINFPGHFLVRVGSQLVDPFRMSETSEPECLAGLGESGRGAVGADVFRRASPQTVLLRMLNNLKYQFARSGEWHRGLDMVDLQLAVEPDNARLLLERGEMWSRLKAVAPAREALERAISLAQGRDPEVVKAARALLAELATDRGLIH